jgi:hypothetical protein
MSHLLIFDRGNDLQMWKVNDNKQSLTVTGLTTLHHNEVLHYEIFNKTTKLDGFLE